MRSDAREAAFQIIFADLFGGDGKKGFRSAIYKEHKLKEDECAFAEQLVNAVFFTSGRTYGGNRRARNALCRLPHLSRG